MLSAVIIEDEEAAVELLSIIIDEYCTGLQVVGSTGTVDSAIQLIEDKAPDIVFFDIELEDGNSFEVIERLGKADFGIIFTTAYDQYALKAFKVEAVDYLLKPYSPKDVIASIDRVKSRIEKQTSIGNLKNLLVETQLTNSKTRKIPFHTSEGIIFSSASDILYCIADRSYCMIYFHDETKLLVSKSLGEVEADINDSSFIRVHASYLINSEHMNKFIKEDGGFLLMKNGKEIPVSRRKKQEFLDRVKK